MSGVRTFALICPLATLRGNKVKWQTLHYELFYRTTSYQILLNDMSNNVSITNYVTRVLLKYSMQLSKNIKHVQTRLAMAALALLGNKK